MRRLLALLLLSNVSAYSPLLREGEPVAAQAVGDAPARAAGPGVVYDVARRRTVLYGGVTDSFAFVGSWEWDGTAWHARKGASPPPRYNHGMVYDPRRGVVIVFGGEGPDGKALADIWELDAGVWRERTTTGPPARAAFGAAFDEARGRMVVYGGFAPGASAPFHDTWEWDGTSWMRAAVDGPPGTTFHKLAYDARRQRVVSFGGRGGGGETWEWDGHRWTRMATGGPPPRDHHAMTYDSRRSRVVMFGGGRQLPDGRYDREHLWLTDLWAWDGVRWTQLRSAGPGSRGGNPGLAYDAARDRLVLWGGGLLDGVWEWNDRDWVRADH